MQQRISGYEVNFVGSYRRQKKAFQLLQKAVDRLLQSNVDGLIGLHYQISNHDAASYNDYKKSVSYNVGFVFEMEAPKLSEHSFMKDIKSSQLFVRGFNLDHLVEIFGKGFAFEGISLSLYDGDVPKMQVNFGKMLKA